MYKDFWEKKPCFLDKPPPPTEATVLKESETKQTAQWLDGSARGHRAKKHCCFQNTEGTLPTG